MKIFQGFGLQHQRQTISYQQKLCLMTNQIKIEYFNGAANVGEIWKDMLENKVPGSTGVMACLVE